MDSTLLMGIVFLILSLGLFVLAWGEEIGSFFDTVFSWVNDFFAWWKRWVRKRRAKAIDRKVNGD